MGHSRVACGSLEACGAGKVQSTDEVGGGPAAGCGCARVGEEGWRGVPDAGESDAAGTDVEGSGRALGGGGSAGCLDVL